MVYLAEMSAKSGIYFHFICQQGAKAALPLAVIFLFDCFKVIKMHPPLTSFGACRPTVAMWLTQG